MALIEFMDGFDHYESDGDFTGSDLKNKWTAIDANTAALVHSIYARNPGGRGIHFQISNSELKKTLPGGALATRCAAFAVRLGTSASQLICQFVDAGTNQMELRTNASNQLTATRNGTVVATSTNALVANVWYWIEFKVTISNASGVVEVRVNGTSTGWIPNTTGLDTQNTANATANEFWITSTNPSDFDDVVVADDFVGTGQIVALLPMAAGNSAQWDPNYGANHGAVGEVIADGDDSFVQTSTAGDIDLFTFQDLPASAGTIVAIQHVLTARQDIGAQRQIRPKQRSGVTNYNGTTVNLGSTYTAVVEVKNTNPDTSAAWTVAGVNAAEFGYELVA